MSYANIADLSALLVPLRAKSRGARESERDDSTCISHSAVFLQPYFYADRKKERSRHILGKVPSGASIRNLVFTLGPNTYCNFFPETSRVMVCTAMRVNRSSSTLSCYAGAVPLSWDYSGRQESKRWESWKLTSYTHQSMELIDG